MNWQRIGNIAGKNGADGVAPDLETVARAAAALIPPPVDGRDGRNGKDVDSSLIDSLRALVGDLQADVLNLRAEVAAAKGAAAAVPDLIATRLADAIAAIPKPKDGTDGRSVDVAEVDALIAVRIDKAMADIPKPKDGASVTVDDLSPLIASEVAKAVSAIPPAKDGVGVFGIVIDRSGHLNVTLSDGTTKDLGPVVGRDVDMAEVSRQISAELAAWPRPKDGQDGKDGLGFDDMDVVIDERGCFLRFVRDGQMKEYRLPVVMDRGVYRPDVAYHKGDGVTWGGSFWIAQEASTGAKPGDAASTRAWRLSVKRGADGKAGAPGKDGTNGRDGKDVTRSW